MTNTIYCKLAIFVLGTIGALGIIGSFDWDT